mgnify:CR=1 FL=1
MNERESPKLKRIFAPSHDRTMPYYYRTHSLTHSLMDTHEPTCSQQHPSMRSCVHAFMRSSPTIDHRPSIPGLWLYHSSGQSYILEYHRATRVSYDTPCLDHPDLCVYIPIVTLLNQLIGEATSTCTHWFCSPFDHEKTPTALFACSRVIG